MDLFSIRSFLNWSHLRSPPYAIFEQMNIPRTEKYSIAMCYSDRAISNIFIRKHESPILFALILEIWGSGVTTRPVIHFPRKSIFVFINSLIHGTQSPQHSQEVRKIANPTISTFLHRPTHSCRQVLRLNEKVKVGWGNRLLPIAPTGFPVILRVAKTP